jgi:hypothetical protein
MIGCGVRAQSYGIATAVGAGALAIALLAGARPAAAQAADPPLPPPRVRAWQTGLLRPDRLQHASLSFTGSLALGVLTRKPGAAAAGAAVLGVAKELWDMRRSRFDPVDLAADGVGAGLGAAITLFVER